MRFSSATLRAARGLFRPRVAAMLGLGVGLRVWGPRALVEGKEPREGEEEGVAGDEPVEAGGEEAGGEEGGVEVCGEDELAEGQMKEFVVGPNAEKDKVVVAHVDGQLYAVSAFCTHFNFQLSKGLLLGERLFCPLHLACFSVKNGLNEFGPTFKPLSVHPVSVRNGRVFVHWTPTARPAGKPPSRRDPHDERHFLIVGGGPAGLAAADTLRSSGFTGRVTIVAGEGVPPFDRTMLSKNIKAELSKISLRDETQLAECDIELLPGVVEHIDERRGTATLTDGRELSFTKALLATGGKAFNPFGPRVLTLRNFADLEAVRERAASARNIVIVGSSYIAIEAASMLRDAHKDTKITLLPRYELYNGKLTPQAAAVMRRLVAAAGVEVRVGVVRAVEEGHILLASGETLPADLVLAGVGILPNTSSIRPELIGATGGCRVDRFLQASENLFAAGDVAEIEGNRVEHYAEAIEQGMVAAWNMLGRRRPHVFVPFFWTRAFNQSVASVGLAPPNAQVLLQGDLAKPSFVEFQCDAEHCPAMKGVNAGEKVVLFAQAMRMGRRITPSEAAQPDFFERLKEEIRQNTRLCRCMREQNSL